MADSFIYNDKLDLDEVNYELDAVKDLPNDMGIEILCSIVKVLAERIEILENK